MPSLRKRFQQNQEDCTYHVLALLPSLGNQILEDMDVEQITLALQQTRATAPSSSAAGQPSAQGLALPSAPTLLQESRQAPREALSESMISAASSGADSASSTTNSLLLDTSPPRRPSEVDPASIPTPSSPILETSGLAQDWIAEFHASQLSQSQGGENEDASGLGRTDNDSPDARSDAVSYTGTTASLSLPPTDTENESVSGESTSAVVSVLCFDHL